MQNVIDTVASQYANSPRILQLIADANDTIDPAADIDEFYRLVWDVSTAEGYGLDVWGRIVNVGRVLTVANEPIFGFDEALPGVGVFNDGVFYAGGSTTSNYALSDTAYRVLILAKAAANICDGSTPAINKILMTLFAGRGDCYVVDNLDMSMVYTFRFVLTNVERAIVTQSGALPRPSGVSATFAEIP